MAEEVREGVVGEEGVAEGVEEGVVGEGGGWERE